MSERARPRIAAAGLLLLALVFLFPDLLSARAEEAEFTGVIGKRMTVRAAPRESANSLGQIEKDTRVDVYSKGRVWTRIGDGTRKGYVLTKFVELVQRKNPFEGSMPGTSRHIAVGRAVRDFSFRPEGYRYPIEVKAGALLSVHTVRNGRAYFPYRREEKDVSVPLEVLELTEFTDWREAVSGDLLYAFTTFYSMSAAKEGNLNRVQNIDLASARLTGIVIPAGESFSFNAVCGPYEKENGYLPAPILSGESKMGYGGGVCQVCSTIYNIVLRMPTVVEDMNWHSQGGVAYLPAGFDATVSNTKDMVFRNLLPYGVRLEFESLSGVMTALLYRN